MMDKLIVALTFLFLNGCLQGTGTGNPEKEPAANIGDSPSIEIFICSKISTCYPEVDYQTCHEGLYRQTNIDTEIGLPQGQYPDYEAVVAADANGEISGNSGALIQCQIDTHSLSCQEIDTMAAYDPLAQDPFSGLANIIPASCAGIYSSD